MGLVRFHRPSDTVNAVQFTGDNWAEIAQILRVPVSQLHEHWPMAEMEYDKDGNRMFSYGNDKLREPLVFEPGTWLIISNYPRRTIVGFASEEYFSSWRQL